MALPRHLCPTSEFYRKAQLQQTGGGAGGGEPNQAELLAGGRLELANTERAIFVEKTAFQGAALIIKIQAEDGENDWALFLAVFLGCLEKLIEARVKQNGPSSFWPEIYLTYRKGVEPMEVRFIPAYITLPRICVFPGDNLQSIIAEARVHFNARNETFQKQSDLFVDAIHCGRIHISNISPFGAGLGYSPLPGYLKEKKAIVNVQNKDERCFGYAILAWWKGKAVEGRLDHLSRAQLYKEADFHELALDGIKYPVEPAEVSALETQLGISINVYSYSDDEGRKIYPYYITHLAEAERGHVSLLYFNNHWAWIRNFSRFAARTRNQGNRKLFWCERCLTCFYLEDKLRLHKQNCCRPDFCEKVVYSEFPTVLLQTQNLLLF